MDRISRYWKAIVALAGSLLMIWNEYSPGFADILPPSWSHGITIAVGVLTVIATYGVPNVTNNPLVARDQSARLNPRRHMLPEDDADQPGRHALPD